MRIFKTLTLFMFFIGSVYAQKNPTFTESQFQDDPNKEWCYLKKSATVIGMPYQPRMSLVTYDGSIFTGEAELSFFYGKEKKPMFARQKTWLEGWIPAVEYDWSDEKGVKYEIEMFAYPIDNHSRQESVNFIKLTVSNPTNLPQEVYVTAATRGRLEDYRSNMKKEFDNNRELKMTTDEVTLDERVIYTYPSDFSQRYAVDGKAYTHSFKLKDEKIDIQTLCGAVEYSSTLGAGAKKSYIFKMPLISVDRSSEYAKDIHKADYDKYRAKMIAYWKNYMQKSEYNIPEKRINDAYKASMVHLILSTRSNENGRRYQTDGIPYENFFLTSGPQMVLAYLSLGDNESAKKIVEAAITQQEESGLYFDKSLAHGGVIPTAHGHVLYCIGSYWFYTRDRKFIERLFPSIEKAIDYLQKATSEDEFGLLPPTYQYDNEMIDGHYASNNFWALLGLRHAIRIAEELGHKKLATEWRGFENIYTENIKKGIDAVMEGDNYVHTGLHPYHTGSKNTQRGFCEFCSDCDWENMLLAYPIELYPENHPYVKGTLKHVRKSYAEGIMTYRHGKHLHQYITANMIEQYMVSGDARQALIDFYHIALHCGSTHEGFENMVLSWNDRNVINFCLPPHAWAAAKIAVLTRNFLLYEYGGHSGLEKGRDLYLMSVLSPEWVQDGKEVSIKNAQCEMGVISAKLKSFSKHAKLTYQAEYTERPTAVKFRIPFCKKLKSFKSDDPTAHREGDYIVLNPSFTYVDIEWADNMGMYKDNFAHLLKLYRECNIFVGTKDPDQSPDLRMGKVFFTPEEKDGRIDTLNFELVKKAFIHEMTRRHKEGEVPALSNLED